VWQGTHSFDIKEENFSEVCGNVGEESVFSPVETDVRYKRCPDWSRRHCLQPWGLVPVFLKGGKKQTISLSSLL
jgi:hypothetical protein